MVYTLLRLLFFTLCCEAVRNQFHWKETKTTFTTHDYHSNASYRNAHHNAHSQRWHAAYDRAVNGKDGSWTQTTIATASWDAVRLSEDHNSLVAETTQRAMRKTGAPNRTQSVRSEGYGNVTERMNGKSADDTKPHSGGRTHLGASAGYVQRGHRTRAYIDIPKHTRTSHSRQRRNAVRGRERHREMNQAATLSADTLRDPTVILEPLPYAMAQERGPDFLFNESSDYDLFTPPDLDDSTPFVPVNTQTRRKQLKNPFYPLTAESYGAYAVTVVAVIIFTAGIIGNMAIMCIVCHNYYMRSISNSLLANLALWDFVIIFFCLPLVVFHELTKDWLLGAFSCKIIPYLEVASLGVTTFTLCALCIDRFRAASNVQLYYEMVENCASTAAKMAVIWVGALLLALPELLIRQLATEEEGVVAEGGSPPGGRGERCAVRVSTALPDTLYVLGLTYDGARLWWHFGCYFCLPTLFTIGCSLATARRIRASEKRARSGGGNRKQVRLESQMNCAVVALAVLYGCCVVPENICNVLDAYMAAGVAATTLDALRLVSQLLLFAKSAATPVLLCCLCRPFAGAFLDCCCCCCLGECAPATPDPRPHAASDNEDECTTTELELSPFNTARRDAGARAH